MVTVLILTATACNHLAVTTKLPLAERPTLERIKPGELKCLSKETYKKMVKNRLAIKKHIEKLEATIKATHK